MAKQLQHQNSNVAYEKKYSGCMWSFFHFLDFHQRLRIRKKLTDRCHGDGKRYAGIKTPKSYAPSIGEKHDILESGTNFLIGNKGNTLKRKPSKGRIRALFSKSLARRQDQKQEMLHVTPRLLRTISIHHLECNDYVIPDEETSDNEISTVYFNSHESDSSAASEHVPLLPGGPDGHIFGKTSEACRAMNTLNHMDYNLVDEFGDLLVEEQARLVEMLNEAKESLSKQKHVDAKGLGRDVLRDFINMLELHRTDRELFLKILKDQNFVWEAFLQRHHSSGPKKILTKSGSFPGAGLSGRKAGPSRLNSKWKESEIFVDEEMKSQLGNTPSISSTMAADAMASNAGIKVDILKSKSASVDVSGVGSSSEILPGSTRELKSQRDHETILYHFKDLEQRLEDVINKNMKESHRISMDGVLHKVPYGQKVTEDVMKEQLHRSASSRCDRESTRDKIVISGNRYPHRSIQRSRSLTESLDRYSHLLESISMKESKSLPESLKSSHEDSGLQNKKTPKTFGRIFSNPEWFRSHSFTKAVQSEVFHEAPPSEVSAAGLLDGDAAVNINNSLGPESVETLVHTKQIKESDTFTEHSIDINVSTITDGGLEHSLLMNEHDQSEISKVSYPTKEDTSHIPLHEVEIRISRQPVLVSEHDQNEIQDISDLREENTSYISLHEKESGTEMYPTDKQSSISVLDSFLEEDPVTSAKYLTLEADPDLEPRSLHCKEPDDSPTAENPLGADASNVVEIVESSSGKINLGGLTNVNAFHIQVDQQDESEFNYVRAVLKKCGFVHEEFLGTWNSPYQQADPLPLGEVDGRPNALDIAAYDHDMSLDHELLLDLIHEVLLEIYESSFASSPWFSCFVSQIKPLLVGHHVLREVWGKISWHLSSRKQVNRALESIMARNFAKNDGWLNLQWDVECVGMELDGLILDNLLDELILEFDDITDPCFASS
ncbi:uncharacterized protein LOC103721983 isoform X1 [Phoenix dactylifera]|uniref:Uncharacterized protein LOC103721983 isoform X1 n=1 Tax=Phoenix dactylifera TaxID=42345 RepID=A0A8B7D159_PHODC|nr:uncharacterized protein LOC103721983 isoform X1 [Phoenix dactylifera]